MQVQIVLQEKGSDVVTAAPGMSLRDVIALLDEKRIGAVVVSSDGVRLDGIVSERDVVRALAREGAAALSRTAVEVMTTGELCTCTPDDTVESLMTTMTDRRVRHIPVVVDGAISGLVSIGDVVKSRISVLEHEARAMHDYISNPY
ncbi:MAG: CBS domain-containing protein [Acidimicrobiales bacterium]|nr:CBS domain-containing protein [Acidimicrobiales bacterium]